jgi:hypothetical protein
MPMPETLVALRLRDDALDGLDAYRAAQKSPPSRARAAQELVSYALKVLEWTKTAKEANHAAQ